MRKITLIIIHCSATRAGQCLDFQACRRDHMNRGFRDIGYHYYITRDGHLHEGRPLDQVGAHCRGHNRHSVGICYEGGLNASGIPADTRTSAQRKTLLILLRRLHLQFPSAIILGHRDLSPDLNGNGLIESHEWLKACPSFDAILEYEELQPEGVLAKAKGQRLKGKG